MALTKRSGRLRRSDCSEAGLRRVRRGRGFSYVDEGGRPVEKPETLERVRALAIPPAWRDVWICPDPLGHLQATGIDAAGRKQYLYHQRWREHRDREKFRRMESFGARLPNLRRRIATALRGDQPTREQVLACAVRLLDVGMFRIGSEEYADDDGGIGLATIKKEHVYVTDAEAKFHYPAKGGAQRGQLIVDHASVRVIRTLKRRRSGGDQLLAYRDGRAWSELRSEEINDYLKRRLGEEFSAKDFRTWNATVLAAVSLATDGRGAESKTARRQAINRSVRSVAELLGNTPAVARRSYIDPRVIDRYLSGWTIADALDRLRPRDPGHDRDRARIERAVLDLLAENGASAGLEGD
jgi:DNA topoisomerase IB